MNGLDETRVAIRKMVREFLAEMAKEHPDNEGLFWRAVRDEAVKHHPLPERELTNIRPMDELQGKRFGREVLGFGAWMDCDYEHVFLQDPDYLDWLADRGMELLRWLKWRKGKI